MLQFLVTMGTKLNFRYRNRQIYKEIQTVETVLGMTNLRERLLVRAGNSGCRYISTGQSDEIIRINGDTMPYIAVWKDNIVLTNWKSHEINCYDICGVHQWSFTNDNLRSPNGVATDKEGNVFVVGTYSHNILILSKNYKETNTYWFQDAEMRYPIAVDYDQSSDKLIVCNMKGTVKAFDVATAVT
ncbi:unnamed protein product [Mytilus edulis]|uniref:Uncharacterized protein n=1 Tax=Mytilus edulis TaxID=6550 RepID=A0A8S3QFZ6_MYTED|nr:unnamed protein product [Mytilus edulis]